MIYFIIIASLILFITLKAFADDRLSAKIYKKMNMYRVINTVLSHDSFSNYIKYFLKCKEFKDNFENINNIEYIDNESKDSLIRLYCSKIDVLSKISKMILILNIIIYLTLISGVVYLAVVFGYSISEYFEKNINKDTADVFAVFYIIFGSAIFTGIIFYIIHYIKYCIRTLNVKFKNMSHHDVHLWLTRLSYEDNKYSSNGRKEEYIKYEREDFLNKHISNMIDFTSRVYIVKDGSDEFEEFSRTHSDLRCISDLYYVFGDSFADSYYRAGSRIFSNGYGGEYKFYLFCTYDTINKIYVEQLKLTVLLSIMTLFYGATV